MDVWPAYVAIVPALYAAWIVRRHWREVQRRRHDPARVAQLMALCQAQQHWIRRGEVACVDCPELGSCVVRGACEREACD